MPQSPLLSERVKPRDLEAAGSRVQRRCEDAQEGCFTGAVVTKHGHVLAGIQHEVDALQGRLGAEVMGQPVRDDHAHWFSGGVFSNGQSTNGPARNKSSVATMIAIATRGE